MPSRASATAWWRRWRRASAAAMLTQIAAAAVVAAPAPDTPSAQAQGVEHTAGAQVVDLYALDLSIEPDVKQVSGTVTITLHDPVAPGHSLRLDVARELYINNISVDGTAVRYAHTGDALDVELPPLEPAQAATVARSIVIRYAGTPAERYFGFDQHNGSDAIASYGLPYSAMHWWPCFDNPRVKAKEADIVVSVPGNLSVASNGVLVGVNDLADGTRAFHWHEHYPIYADTISVAIAAYTRFELTYADSLGSVLPIQFFVFPDDVEHAKADFAVLPEILRSYEELFGPYPFRDEKYGVAEFERTSFREHQTLPSLGAKYLTGRNENAWILAHELAHQWFGNSLSPESWTDVWLNESFAQYAVALWQERHAGSAAYRAFLQTLWASEFSGSVYVEDANAVERMFGPATFGKGAWVLHMLRHVMGDSAFFRALKTYATDNRHGHVTTHTWQAACERTYGRSLQWFFDEWIYGQGQPTLRLDWDANKGGDSTYTLHIAQTQSGKAFTMPVDLRIVTWGGTVNQTVWLNRREKAITLRTQDAVRTITLDPDAWLLQGTRPGTADEKSIGRAQ